MPIYRQADGVLAEDLDGKAAIVDPEGKELITLNLVGSLVWNLLDGHRDVDAVISAVVEACAPVEPGTVDVDVRAFLAELGTLHLIVASEE
jgi:Coenzyme PQQ synthesis protein D (PqqD)